MALIRKKLEQWRQAGLLTPDQSDAILAFESDNPQKSNWWIYSFMILGAAIIGLGIISLIAANWADIPDSVKLGCDFALLGALAAGVFWQHPHQSHGIWFEVLLVSFLLLCLASIGLIAQIYHVSGNWFHALLFWAVITLPVTLYARNLFTRFFWVTLFLHGLLWSIVDLAAGHLGHSLEEQPAIFLLAPLLTALLYYASLHVKNLRGFSAACFFWFQLTAIITLIFIDILRSGGEMPHVDLHAYIPAWLAAAALGAGIVLHQKYRPLNKALLLAVLILLLLYYYPDLLFTGEQRYTFFGLRAHESVSLWRADDIRAPLLTLLILFLYAIHAGNIGHQRTFNMVTFLIGLRFVILYFQAMGGLAATGVGLIVSGSLIVGISWLWYKGRDPLRLWAKELKA